jgi:transposase-like protein
MRDNGVVCSKVMSLALVLLDSQPVGHWGMWIERAEGAKSWLRVFTDLKPRGCGDTSSLR